MKIIIISYYYEPRLGYQEPNLTRELAKLGHDVYLITSNKRYPPGISHKSLSLSIGERTVKEGFFVEGKVKVIRLKSIFEIFSRTWLKNLEKTLIELKPDVVVVNSVTRFSSFRVPFLKWRKKLDFTLVYDEHMVYSVVRQNLLGKIFYFLFRLIVRPLLLSQGNVFIAVTEETKVFMNRECGIPLSSIELVPLGVNQHLFKYDELSRKQLRSQYGISQEDVVFIYAGKIIAGKGPHLLIDAGLKLLGKHKDLKLFFLGNGNEEYINKMKNKVEKNGFGTQIIWDGAVNNKELYKYYSAADVGVWPLQESMTMLEAASCNLPIIVRDTLSLADRISNGNGFGYKEGDMEDLAKYMEICLTNKELRKKMGAKGRELIEKRLNWEAVAKEYVKLYSKVPPRS